MNVLEVGQGGSGHLELRGDEDSVTVSLFTFHCVTLYFYIQFQLFSNFLPSPPVKKIGNKIGENF